MPELTLVKTLNQDGTFGPDRLYTIAADVAVVCAWRQDSKDWNTWTYPEPAEAGVVPGSKLGSFILSLPHIAYGGFPQEPAPQETP